MCHPYFLINSMDKRSRKLLIPCQNRRIKYAKELACIYWSAKIAAEINSSPCGENLPHVLSINNFPSQYVVSRWTESYITSPQNLDKIKETLSLRFLGLRRSRRPLKQKKKRLLFSYLDRKSLVNKGLSYNKIFRFGKNQDWIIYFESQ